MSQRHKSDDSFDKLVDEIQSLCKEFQSISQSMMSLQEDVRKMLERILQLENPGTPIIYGVYDNGRRARYPECNVGSDWDNNEFPSFQEAEFYARHWLGKFDSLPEKWDGKPYNYSGYGDFIEIRTSVNPTKEQSHG